MEAKIIFKNGTELIVEKNGSCFIANEKPDFPEDLTEVVETGEEEKRIYHDAYLIECASVDKKYWFTFGEETESEKTIRRLREDNDMLTECILEMSEIVYGE